MLAQEFDNVSHVCRHGRFEMSACEERWMNELQTIGVERLAGDEWGIHIWGILHHLRFLCFDFVDGRLAQNVAQRDFFAAVHRVANDRVIDIRKVHAELMGAAGLGVEL